MKIKKQRERKNPGNFSEKISKKKPENKTGKKEISKGKKETRKTKINNRGRGNFKKGKKLV